MSSDVFDHTRSITKTTGSCIQLSARFSIGTDFLEPFLRGTEIMASGGSGMKIFSKS